MKGKRRNDNAESSRTTLEDEPIDDANDDEQKKKPVASFGPYSTGSGSLIEVSIWENIVMVDNGAREARMYAVSFSRSYRENGKWSKTKSLRPHDIPILQYALGKALDWIFERKAE